MKTKEEIINELKTHGISIIENYFSEKYCNDAINEIDSILLKYSGKIQSNLVEGTSGDQRVFKIEEASISAKKFQDDQFIHSILKSVSKNKIESHFILGGKLDFSSNEIKNSGGGWHRDSDHEQFKSMVYLEDVDTSNGPFLFLQKSDKFDLERRTYDKKRSIFSRIYILLGKIKKNPPRYSDLTVKKYIKKSGSVPLEVVGKKGTLVLFNSTYLHRGKNIEKGIRYTFTNYMFKSNFLSKYFRTKQFQKFFISSDQNSVQ